MLASLRHKEMHAAGDELGLRKAFLKWNCLTVSSAIGPTSEWVMLRAFPPSMIVVIAVLLSRIWKTMVEFVTTVICREIVHGRSKVRRGGAR